MEDCTFVGSFGIDGGAIHAGGASIHVARCLFEGNYADEGAGIFVAEGASASIVDCRFENNTAHHSAIRSWGTLSIAACHFVDNTAYTAAAFTSFGRLFMADTSIVSGYADYIGAAAIWGPAYVTRCAIVDNDALWSDGGFATGSEAILVTDSFFKDNRAGFWGGGSFRTGPNGLFVNCTVVNHGGFLGVGEPTMINCIVRSVAWDYESSPTVLHSNVTGGFPGPGNIDADPLFVDPEGGDYRLQDRSPCIDAGHNWGVPAGSTLDLDGNPRFVHVLDDAPGCGSSAIVDMGAFEFQGGTPAQIVFGDIDGDGGVGAPDLDVLQEQWGPCEPGCCLSDLDLDGTVGIGDLLNLLASWG